MICMNVSKSFELSHILLLVLCLDGCVAKLFEAEKGNIKIFQPDQSDHAKYKRSSTFTCHSSGKFENVENRNSYWYCDVSPSGGFVAIRRSCPSGQIFSAYDQRCISKTDKRCGMHNSDKKIACSETVPEETETTTTECSTTTTPCLTTTTPCSITTKCTEPTTKTCFGLMTSSFKCHAEGAFRDPDNCNNFYICHLKKHTKNTYEKLKVKCPEGMAFDDKLGWCSCEGKELCELHKAVVDSRKISLKKRERSLHRERSYLRGKINDQRCPRNSKIRKRFIDDLPVHLRHKRYDSTYNKRLQNLEREAHSPKGFKCSSKGRYPDPSDLSNYFICYPKEFGNGYLMLRMKCPGHSMFNAKSLVCSERKNT